MKLITTAREPIEKQQIINAYLECPSIKELSHSLGVSNVEISRLSLSFGIDFKELKEKYNKLPLPLIDEKYKDFDQTLQILVYLNQGITTARLAYNYNVNQNTIYRVSYEAGYKPAEIKKLSPIELDKLILKITEAGPKLRKGQAERNQRDKEIIDCYEKIGKSVKVQKELKVTEYMVQSALRRLKINREDIIAKYRVNVVNHYKNSDSFNDTLTHYGISLETLRSYIDESAEKNDRRALRKKIVFELDELKQGISRTQKEEIAQRSINGESKQSLAAEFDVSVSQIYHWESLYEINLYPDEEIYTAVQRLAEGDDPRLVREDLDCGLHTLTAAVNQCPLFSLEIDSSAEEKIVAEYLTGKTTRLNLAAKYGLKIYELASLLDKHGARIKKEVPKDEQIKIINRINSGESTLYQEAKALGYHEQSLANWQTELIKDGLVSRKRPSMHDFTKADIVEAYSKCLCSTETAKSLNISKALLSKIISKHSLSLDQIKEEVIITPIKPVKIQGYSKFGKDKQFLAHLWRGDNFNLAQHVIGIKKEHIRWLLNLFDITAEEIQELSKKRFSQLINKYDGDILLNVIKQTYDHEYDIDWIGLDLDIPPGTIKSHLSSLGITIMDLYYI